MIRSKQAYTIAGPTYAARFEPAEEGGPVARFPPLPSRVTEGET